MFRQQLTLSDVYSRNLHMTKEGLSDPVFDTAADLSGRLYNSGFDSQSYDRYWASHLGYQSTEVPGHKYCLNTFSMHNKLHFLGELKA